MQTKFKIIETDSYILAVSDEEIKEGDWCVYNSGEIIQYLVKLNTDNLKKIIIYTPKGNALELEGLPLLPEMVVEDDKAATKVYSEEDLRKAFLEGNKYPQESKYLPDFYLGNYFEKFLQSLKQPTPKWFVAEMEYYYHTSKDLYTDAGFVKCTKEQYESIKSEIPTCPLKTELKTTTINGKTYLVGKFVNE
jgi:hypothetical protein